MRRWSLFAPGGHIPPIGGARMEPSPVLVAIREDLARLEAAAGRQGACRAGERRETLRRCARAVWLASQAPLVGSSAKHHNRPVRRTVAAFGAVVAIAASLGANNAGAAPVLSIGEARAAINAWLERNYAPLLGSGLPILTDWNVSRCFRRAPNRVQCRWSLTGTRIANGEIRTLQCFGNIAATKTNARVRVRRLSFACNPPG